MLRGTEAIVRKSVPVPKLMETFLIEQATPDLVRELMRTVYDEREDGHMRIRRLNDGSWSISFFTIMHHEEGETTESSIHVTCDENGKNCRVDVAG
jgi:hypothetical protein